eukprot:COSAG01_NODE_41392_length_452_cov_0.685552_2_plen_58_part_01
MILYTLENGWKRKIISVIAVLVMIKIDHPDWRSTHLRVPDLARAHHQVAALAEVLRVR